MPCLEQASGKYQIVSELESRMLGLRNRNSQSYTENGLLFKKSLERGLSDTRLY